MPTTSSFEQFDQFERSIVRFFKPQGTEEAGVGFWVEGNYLVTCAHVVNAALGLPDQSPDRPTKSIALEFVKAGARRSARVVGWHRVLETHEISDRTLEDLAILQLSEPPPDLAMAAGSLLATNYQVGSLFKALGFADEGGRWAYGQLCDRWPTTGWIQLEADKTEGKRVEGGFSGTPVWDAVQSRVVGLVVAADRAVGDRVAMAIPAAKLRSALRQLDVDSLVQILGSDSSKLLPLSETYDLIKPPGYLNPCPKLLPNLLAEIQEMLQQDAPGDRLLLFAVALSLNINQVPLEIRDRLREWLAVRSPDPNALESYLNKLDLSPNKLDLSNESESVGHALIVVDQPSDDLHHYRIKAWKITNKGKEAFQDDSKNQWLIPSKSFIDELPGWLQHFRGFIGELGTDRIIEFFLPNELLNSEIDQVKIQVGDSGDSRKFITFGRRYNVVLRSTTRLQKMARKANSVKANQNVDSAYEAEREWRDNWKKINSQFQNRCAAEHLKLLDQSSLDCDFEDLLYDLLDTPEIVGIQCRYPDHQPCGGRLELVQEAGMAVAVWVRSHQEAMDLHESGFEHIIAGPLSELRDRVQDARRKNRFPIAKHLSLLWEDPDSFPPGYLDCNQSLEYP